MRGKWEEVTIGALLARDGGSIKTGPFGTALKAKEYSATGVPLISVGEVGYGSLQVHEKTPRVPQAVVDRLPEYVLESGDIVFGRKGAVDRCALVKPYQAGWFLGSDGIRLRLPETVDPRFIAFQLQSPGTRAWLVQHATGTTMPSLNQAIIERIPLRIPPLHQQRAIAQVLGTLDDKIQLNRRMSETLEEMARALFESWFVRFDPVRAKMEGRDPGLPPDLAALFPDRLVDSELGEVPAGWEIGTFGAIIKERTERVAGRQAVVLSAVSSGKLVPSEEFFNKRVHSRDISRYLLVEQGDFAYNPARINIGSIGMLQDDVVGAVSPVYVVFRPRKEFGWFLEFSLRRASVRAWIETLASGSVRQTLSYRDFASIPCVIPPVQLVEEFNKRWLTLREGIRSRDAESRTLAEIRDTLLPKLISGELRVKDAERLVAAAT